MGLVSRAGNEDSLKVIFKESQNNSTKVIFSKHSVNIHATKKELPAGELSGVPAPVVQVSAYCSPAAAHMPSPNKKETR
jgi:hypothetical protein